MKNNIQLCKLCKDHDTKIVYSGKIRSGSFGNFSPTEYSVYQCNNCGVEFLYPFPEVNYETDEYRSRYNNSSEITKYFDLHDRQQIQYLNLFKEISFRNKKICDIGCGGGAFLDHVQGLSQMTIAVEPYLGYHNSLKERGHKVFSDIGTLREEFGDCSLDLIISFHVIEHLIDPIKFLKIIKALLRENGVAIILTLNLDDILLKIIKEKFTSFWYRTAHLWYFGHNAFNYLIKELNFSKSKISYLQNFDISNFLFWLTEGKPAGNNKFPIFNEYINSSWKTFLEQEGCSDSILMQVTK